MEIRHLSSFIAVAETRSATMASKRCNVTQSAISQHIKSLESELSVALFKRNGKTMELTDYGRMLLDKARLIVKESRSIKEDIMSSNGNLTGDLNIGVGPFIEPLVGPLIAEFMNTYRKVKLHVHYNYANELNKKLRNGELDVAFSMNTAYYNEGILSRPFKPFRLFAIMDNSNPLASREVLGIEDALSGSVILPEMGKREIATMQQYLGFDADMVLNAAIAECNNANSILNALKPTNSITFLPGEYAMKRTDLVAIPVRGMEEEIRSNSHVMLNRTTKPGVRALLNLVK